MCQALQELLCSTPVIFCACPAKETYLLELYAPQQAEGGSHPARRARHLQVVADGSPSSPELVGCLCPPLCPFPRWHPPDLQLPSTAVVAAPTGVPSPQRSGQTWAVKGQAGQDVRQSHGVMRGGWHGFFSPAAPGFGEPLPSCQHLC